MVNPVKSNYLLFNSANVALTINGHVLDNVHVVKYLGIFIDDTLSWSFQINHITRLCCQRIGMFKKILPCLPNNVRVLYYNALLFAHVFRTARFIGLITRVLVGTS